MIAHEHWSRKSSDDLKIHSLAELSENDDANYSTSSEFSSYNSSYEHFLSNPNRRAHFNRKEISLSFNGSDNSANLSTSNSPFETDEAAKFFSSRGNPRPSAVLGEKHALLNLE